MLIGKTERLLGQLIFAAERGCEHRGIIGVERNHHALIEIIAHRVLGDGRTNSSAQVTGNANLHRNLPLGQRFHEFGILRRGKPVTDSFGGKIDCSPDRAGSGSLDRMRGKPESILCGIGVDVAKQFGSGLALISANAESDHARPSVTRG